MSVSTALVVCAHGTDDPDGQQVVRSLTEQVARSRPDLTVRDAYVDVQSPSLPEVVNELVAQHDSVVVVPVLLSSGFHTEVDVAQAAEHDRVSAAGALGPHELLAEVLVDRLRDAGAHPVDEVVLAVAGSSRAAGAADAERMCALLQDAWRGRVRLGYLAAREPSVVDAIASARGTGKRVAVASYLLGPGFFQHRLRRSGADVVADPLGDDPRLADLVLRRFESVDK